MASPQAVEGFRIKYSGKLCRLAHTMGQNLEKLTKYDIFGLTLLDVFTEIYAFDPCLDGPADLQSNTTRNLSNRSDSNANHTVMNSTPIEDEEIELNISGTVLNATFDANITGPAMDRTFDGNATQIIEDVPNEINVTASIINATFDGNSTRTINNDDDDGNELNLTFEANVSGTVLNATFEATAANATFDGDATFETNPVNATFDGNATFEANPVNATFDGNATFEANSANPAFEGNATFDANSANATFDGNATFEANPANATFDGNATFDANPTNATFDGNATFEANPANATFGANTTQRLENAEAFDSFDEDAYSELDAEEVEETGPLSMNEILNLGKQIGGHSRSWIDMLRQIALPVYNEEPIQALYLEYRRSKCAPGFEPEVFNLMATARRIGGNDVNWLKIVKMAKKRLVNQRHVEKLYDEYIKFDTSEIEPIWGVTFSRDMDYDPNVEVDNPFNNENDNADTSIESLDAPLGVNDRSRTYYSPENYATPPSPIWSQSNPEEVLNHLVMDLINYIDEPNTELSHNQIAQIARQLTGGEDITYFMDFLADRLPRPCTNPKTIERLYRAFLKYEQRRKAKLAIGKDPRAARNFLKETNMSDRREEMWLTLFERGLERRLDRLELLQNMLGGDAQPAEILTPE